MKQIKANKFAKAVEALDAIRKGLSEKVKEMINEVDRKYFHVVLLKVIPEPGEAENKLLVQVVQYGKRQFEKMSENFRFHGFSNMIVLHNPDEDDGEETVQVPEHIKSNAEADIRKQLEKDNQKKIDAEVKKRMEAYKAEQAENQEQTDGAGGSDQTPVITENDIVEMDEEALDAFAQEKEINFEGLEDLTEKRAQALTWYNDNIANGGGSKDPVHDVPAIKKLNQEGLLQFATDNTIDLEGKTKVKEIKPIIVAWAETENAKS